MFSRGRERVRWERIGEGDLFSSVKCGARKICPRISGLPCKVVLMPVLIWWFSSFRMVMQIILGQRTGMKGRDMRKNILVKY